MVDDGIAGIAGGIEHLQVRQAVARLLPQPTPGNPRQSDISEQQGDFRMLFENPQSAHTIACLQDTVSQRRQSDARVLADICIILDNRTVWPSPLTEKSGPLGGSWI